MQARRFLGRGTRGACTLFALVGVFLASGSVRAEDVLEIAKKGWAEFQKPNPEKWVALYAADAVIEDLGSGETGTKVKGHKEILAWFERVAVSWPDSTYRPVRMIGQGNSAVIEWRWVGKQKRQFLDSPSAEKSVNLRGVTIWDFEDGKIQHEVTLYNYATMRAQLGDEGKKD